jgi:hypothetical protein
MDAVGIETPEFDKIDSYCKELDYFLLGNSSAINLAKAFMKTFSIWDDLIDKDEQISDGDINKCFWIIFVDLPNNQFYKQYFSLLHPIVINSIINWHAANALEKSGSTEISFMLRSSCIDIISMCAFIVGGEEWARKITPSIRKWSCNETYSEYVNDLGE